MNSIKQHNLRLCSVGISDGVIYDVHRLDDLRWHEKRTKFHEDWFKHSGNIKVITSAI
jgi:hypothetical protein